VFSHPEPFREARHSLCDSVVFCGDCDGFFVADEARVRGDDFCGPGDGGVEDVSLEEQEMLCEQGDDDGGVFGALCLCTVAAQRRHGRLARAAQPPSSCQRFVLSIKSCQDGVSLKLAGLLLSAGAAAYDTVKIPPEAVPPCRVR